MSTPPTLDERINRLAPEVDARIRADLQSILRTLRLARYPVGVIQMMSRPALRLFRLIYEASGKPWPSDNLFDVIIKAANGDPTRKIEGYRILPEALDSPLHTLRTLSNKLDHDAEQFPMGDEEADLVLNAFLSVLKWFYCQSDLTPRLSSLYTPVEEQEEAYLVRPTFRLDRDPETYTPQEQQELLGRIWSLMGGGARLELVSVRRGSVLLTVLMHRKEAENVAATVERGVLTEYGVESFEVEGVVYEPDSPIGGGELSRYGAVSSEGEGVRYEPDSPVVGSPPKGEDDPDWGDRTWPGIDSDPSLTLPPVDGSAFHPPGYEVISLLGMGGLSSVSLARDRFGRKVALKYDQGPLTDASPWHRNEARVLASLDHPNIVRFLDAGEHLGKPFVALEYLEGGDLSRRIAEKPLSPREAAALLKPVAEALDYAHGQGVVHRNVKPRAISFSANGAPKVTSWTLAVAPSGPEEEEGSIVGTPRYMAPEQARADRRSIGPHTDVFALGALLYECLTGRPPFSGRTVMETLQAVLAEDPALPRLLAPTIPRDLESICLKCLEKDPARRYATAADLAADLGRFLDGQPILARPRTTLERAGMWFGRGRWPAPLWLMAATVLVTLFLGYRAENAARRAAEAAARAEQLVAARADDRARHLDAELSLERGLAFCQRGDVAAGVRLLSRGIDIAPNDAADLRWDLRAQLDAWSAPAPSYRLRLEIRGGVTTSVLAADGKTVLVVGMTTVATMSTATGEAAGSHPVLGAADVFAVGPNGSIAYGAGKRVVIVRPGRPPLESLEARVTALAFSPDGKRIVSANYDNTAKVWDATTGQNLLTLKSPAGKVTSVAYSPDGKRLASASQDNPVRVWDAASGNNLLTLRGHAGDVTCLTFSPDGKALLGGGPDGGVHLWDAVSGQALLPPCPHGSAIRSLAFHPSGRLFAVGSEGRRVQLWSVTSGLPIGPAIEQSGPVVAVGFTPSGDVLACSRDDLERATQVLVSVVALSPTAPFSALAATQVAHPAMVLSRWPSPGSKAPQ